MTAKGEEEDDAFDFDKGVAYFWLSTDLEPHVRGVALDHGVSKVAVGNNHSLLLTYNSKVFSVGENSYGQLGLGDLVSRKEPTVIDFFNGQGVFEIASGSRHSGAVCENGSVYFWGDSSSGQCGFEDAKTSNIPIKISFEVESSSDVGSSGSSSLDHQEAHLYEGKLRIKKLSCGDAHTLALTVDGHIWSWGTGSQTGHGTIEKVSTPKRIDSVRGKNVLDIACGAYHCLAIVEDDMTQLAEKTKVQPVQSSSSQGLAKKMGKSKKSSKKSPSKKKSGTESPRDAASDNVSPRSRKTRTYLSYNVREQDEGVLLSDVSRPRADAIYKEQDVGGLTHTHLSTKDEEAPIPISEACDSISNPSECQTTSLDSDNGNKEAETLNIHDGHFGSPDKTTDSSLLSRYLVLPSIFTQSSNQVSASYSVTSPEDVVVAMEVTENAEALSAPTESIYSSSPSSTASGGNIAVLCPTDSDSEEVAKDPLRKAKTVLNTRINTGFSVLGNKVDSEMSANFGKLTSAVVGSVTGMFMASSGHDAPKAVTGVPIMPCKKCGMLGVCLCDGEETGMELSQSNTQVWAWGSGSCAQLGHGDTDDRSFPMCVKDLSRTGVTKIAAGTFHSLALTVYSQVYSWGDNSCGQLGRKKAMALRPKKVKCFSDVLIWDISAGSHYSIFIGDIALNRPDVYICGRQPSAMPKIAAAMSSMRESISMPSLPVESIPTPTNKVKRVLHSSRSFDDAKERSLTHCRVELVRLTMFKKVGQLRSVAANSERCCCVVARDRSGQLEILCELASQERLFYHQLALIWQAVLVPLLHSDVWAFLGYQEDGTILAPVIKNFHCLMKCVSAQQLFVTHMVHEVTDIQGLYKFCLSEDFMLQFERYSIAFSNAVAFGAFTAFSVISSDVELQSKAVLQELLEEKDSLQHLHAFQAVLQIPLTRMQQYEVIIEKLLNKTPENPEHTGVLEKAVQRWKQILIRDEDTQALAEQTREFWAESSAKIMDSFKDPRRRLIRSSKVHNMFLAKSARFSSHAFLLFDDYFLHVQSSKYFQAFSLSTLWAEGLDDSEGVVNSIKITTPEDVLLVCAPTAADKGEWLLAINQAVAKLISKTTAFRLDDNAVNAKTGSLAPATAREGSYTFSQEPKYRGAVYNGMWLIGKPHGHGEMHWPDRRHYTGEFKFGLHHGEGIMIFSPSTADCSWEKYEGHWEDGFMAGHGKMRFNNGDVYTGNWWENQRHGHGTMKCGALSSSAATFYVGEWVQDKKHGYGVMDDIIRGEKYMGMWESDNRHGPGLLVTLDGIYNEGTFVQGKMSGSGVLLCNDNTKYEGEFAAVCQLAGKGLLTLPNGDLLEGSFSGQWRDGVKINGMFFKREKENSSATPNRNPDLSSQSEVIPAFNKWTALFNQCRAELGCHGEHDASPGTAWKCVSFSLVSGHDGKLPKNQEENLQKLLNTNNEVERRGLSAVDTNTVHTYLSKALELRHHPLGHLVNSLEYVFRATYVGMGTHRRLLPFAVSEAKSFVVRLYSLVRLLFPHLPSEDFVHLTTDNLSGVANHFTEEPVTSSAVLHPHLFPRLYPPLFTLYALQNECADSAYQERIMQLNKRSDWSLMTYVGMKKQFWLTTEDESGSRLNEIKLQNRDAEHYVSAVDALRQLSTKFGPMEKLGVLKATFANINAEVESFWCGEEKLISLDDLFPVFHFVVIRARIPNLGSEIHFIEDMVDSHVHVGEHGHMFTTLKACFFQIQKEKG